MTRRQPIAKREWWRLLLGAVGAVVVTLLGTGTASAATVLVAEERVETSTLAAQAVAAVGSHEGGSAGQRWAECPPDALVASGAGVVTSIETSSCFFYGTTVVLMGDGTRRAIQDIDVGDEVIATDPETGEQGARSVEAVFVHDDTVIDLEVEGEIITTTEDHPFWSVTDQRFERADQLSPGEQVLTADGRVLDVAGLALESTRQALAYNLAVHDIHTYHVGHSDILVHNTCGIEAGIYVVRTSKGGVYVGQSGNITRRLAQHVRSDKFTKADANAAQRVAVSGDRQAREIAEQIKLDTFGGRDGAGVLNIVNPIGDVRLDLMPKGYTRP